MSEKKIPQIRFKGFADDWQKRELGEVADRVTRKNSFLESSLPLTISSQHGLVDQISYFNNRVASRDVSNYYLMKRGEFAYNKSYSDGYPFGSVKCLNLYDMGVLSTLYIVFKPKCKFIKNEFLESFYETHNWHKDVAERAAEGARNHGLLNISAEDFFKTCLHFPLLLLEQTRIGEFFKTLDILISSHQRKYDKLMQVKKSLLEKMFPLQGATQPQIRFNGFTDDWEECSLGTLTDLITKGTTPLQKAQSSNEVNFIKIENIHAISGKISPVSRVSNNEHNGYLKRSILKKNDILFSIAGTLGRVALVTPDILPANTNQALSIIRLNCGDLKYIKTYLNGHAIKDYIKKNPTVGAQPNLSLEQVSSLQIKCPKKAEQTRIGAFFKTLDDLITAQQRELDKLKSSKKALLEKMFV